MTRAAARCVRAWLVVAAAIGCAGCAPLAQRDRPALLTNPGGESRGELVRLMSAALGAPMVTIADDAFTRDSTLVIEQRPARDSGGQRLSGRDFGEPQHFQLVRSGTSCVLLHQERRYALRKSKCAVPG